MRRELNILDSTSITQVILNLIIVAILLLLNAFFVAAEFSIVRIRPTRLTQLIKEGHIGAKYTKEIVKRLDAYLSACQVGITLTSVGLGWVGEPAMANILAPVLNFLGVSNKLLGTLSFALGYSLISTFHIVLGELVPKTIAIQSTEKIAIALSMPLTGFYKVTYPIIWLLNHAANGIVRLFGLRPYSSEREQAHTEEEIRLLVDESHKNGLIDQTESMLVDNVFQFSDRIAREVMIPRTSTDVLFIEDSFEENYKKVSETKNTRYPVAEGDKDNIIGFVHIADFYSECLTKGEFDLKKITREILRVPETVELTSLLKLMQKKKILISTVVDEYGGVAGIINLEDMLEEIVGDIQDEFDNERPEIEKNGDVYSVEGRVLIDDLNQDIGTNISNEEVDTIAGWIHMMLEDELPMKGKTIVDDGFVFEIAEMDKNRIARILIRKEIE